MVSRNQYVISTKMIDFEYELLTMRPFFQDQGVERRNSGVMRRLCNADIDKMGSSKWVTLRCAGYKPNQKVKHLR